AGAVDGNAVGDVVEVRAHRLRPGHAAAAVEPGDQDIETAKSRERKGTERASTRHLAREEEMATSIPPDPIGSFRASAAELLGPCKYAGVVEFRHKDVGPSGAGKRGASAGAKGHCSVEGASEVHIARLINRHAAGRHRSREREGSRRHRVASGVEL